MKDRNYIINPNDLIPPSQMYISDKDSVMILVDANRLGNREHFYKNLSLAMTAIDGFISCHRN